MEKSLAISIALWLFFYSCAVLLAPRLGARGFEWAVPEPERLIPRYLRAYRIWTVVTLVFSCIFASVVGVL